MLVCVVSCWFPSKLNPGAGSFVARDVAALATRFDVRVVHLVSPSLHDGESRTHIDGVPVIRVPMNTTNPAHVIRAALKLRKLTRRADLIHTMAAPSLLPFRAFGAWPAPLVHTEHWSGILRLHSGQLPPWQRPIFRALYRRPAALGAVSSLLAEALASVARRDVRTIPNIVDTAGPFQVRPPDGRMRLLSIGSLTEVKDPELALATLAELRARGHDASLQWAGDGELLDQARLIAQRLGISRHVHLPGRQDRAQVQELLRDCDVLLHTSRVETFSLVAAEALCAGRPIVIQDQGGHRDFARQPWAQFVSDRTPAAFADAVERALQVNESGKFEEYASQLAAEHSEEEFLRRWSQTYRQVLAS